MLAEELNQMLSEQLQSHIQENKLNVLGNPIPCLLYTSDAADE